MGSKLLATSAAAALCLLAGGLQHTHASEEQETYAEAERKAEEGSSDPAVVTWYSEQMQPEFRALFQLAMGQCFTRVRAARPKQVGLVFTVEQDGSVGRIFWQERSAFTDCLEDFLRNALFPRPPQPVFYFGIEAELPEDQESP